VNLVDYYVVQHGSYDVPAMFVKTAVYWHDPATWTYCGVNIKVLIAYCAGVAAGYPFVSSIWFQGPLAASLGGTDLSWIPGLVVTSGVYLALTRTARSAHPIAEDLRTH